MTLVYTGWLALEATTASYERYTSTAVSEGVLPLSSSKTLSCHDFLCCETSKDTQQEGKKASVVVSLFVWSAERKILGDDEVGVAARVRVARN